MPRALWIAIALAAIIAAAGCRAKAPPGGYRLTLVYTAEVGGAIDPCG